MVSHDRYFLDKIATRIFSFESGTIRQYPGGYTDWLIQQEDSIETEKIAQKKKQPTERVRTEKPKFSFHEKREFETIDDTIAELEEKIDQTEKELQKSASDFVRLQELTEEKDELNAQLEEKMDRWVYLHDLNDKLNRASSK